MQQKKKNLNEIKLERIKLAGLLLLLFLLFYYIYYYYYLLATYIIYYYQYYKTWNEMKFKRNRCRGFNAKQPNTLKKIKAKRNYMESKYKEFQSKI